MARKQKNTRSNKNFTTKKIPKLTVLIIHEISTFLVDRSSFEAKFTCSTKFREMERVESRWGICMSLPAKGEHLGPSGSLSVPGKVITTRAQ